LEPESDPRLPTCRTATHFVRWSPVTSHPLIVALLQTDAIPRMPHAEESTTLGGRWERFDGGHSMQLQNLGGTTDHRKGRGELGTWGSPTCRDLSCTSCGRTLGFKYGFNVTARQYWDGKRSLTLAHLTINRSAPHETTRDHTRRATGIPNECMRILPSRLECWQYSEGDTAHSTTHPTSSALSLRKHPPFTSAESNVNATHESLTRHAVQQSATEPAVCTNGVLGRSVRRG
jgi:hypothetical protein